MPPQLLALFSAFSYASFTICARLGLNYSTPITATIVSLSVRTLTLWTAVFLTGGIPQVAPIALLLFVILGMIQTATSLLTFTGLYKIGAAACLESPGALPFRRRRLLRGLRGRAGPHGPERRARSGRFSHSGHNASLDSTDDDFSLAQSRAGQSPHRPWHCLCDQRNDRYKPGEVNDRVQSP